MHVIYLLLLLLLYYYLLLLFFFFKLIIHPAIYPFVVHSLYHLSTFLSNLPAGHVKKEAVARYADIQIDLPNVIFSYPK